MPSAPPEYGRPSGAASAEPVLAHLGGADVAGWRAEGASTPWCTIRAASVTGVRHRLAGCLSEDFFAWGHRRDGTLGQVVVAVADGVGSLTGSGDAAARACRAAVQGALAAGERRVNTEDRPGEAAVDAALDAADEASRGGGATTLVVAWIAPDGEVTVGRIGDSSALVVASDGSARELFDGGTGNDEVLDMATPALPGGLGQAERVGGALAPGEALVLVTDGIAGPWRDGPETVAPGLGAAIASVPGPLELLRVADFSRQGCHDDRTIVAVWPKQTVDDA